MKANDTANLSGRTARPLDVTRLGFGGAPLGNLYRGISEEDAQATLGAAFESGITLFDTAPYYGLGRSEERFGIAIARHGRAGIVLSTKIGRLLVDGPVDETTKRLFVDPPERQPVYDYSYDGVMRSHEASLERIGVDAIDILLVHDVDVWTHGSQAAADARVRELFDEGGYRALEELEASGRIAAIGAGVNEWEACEALLGHADFDCFLLAGRYTLIEQEALNSFLPMCVGAGCRDHPGRAVQLRHPRDRRGGRRALQLPACAAQHHGARAQDRERVRTPRRDAAGGSVAVRSGPSRGQERDFPARWRRRRCARTWRCWKSRFRLSFGRS